MKRERILSKFVGRKKIKAQDSKFFVFCEKAGSSAQFQAEVGSDVNHAVERMAGMLAVQCLVRGHNPDDFVVLVPADSGLSGRMVSRAKQLLDEGRAAATPPSLSPRQNEILHSVIRNQANKEIASRLNITVRTVKFHISSLLNKFGVENRMELARRATGFMESTSVAFRESFEEPARNANAGALAGPLASPMTGDLRRQESGRNSVEVSLRSSSKAFSLRFPGSALSA